MNRVLRLLTVIGLSLALAQVLYTAGVVLNSGAVVLNSGAVVLNSGADLDVSYISRTPLYNAYCVQYTWDVPNQPGLPFLCPGTETDRRWPDYGEIVTFTAHIINKGNVASPAFDYSWQIDGFQTASGALPALEPAAEATATFQWAWEHTLSTDGQCALGEHTVGFTVDPVNIIAESYENNNHLQDVTNAMSLHIRMTPEMYAAHNVPITTTLPFSAEDWVQKHIAAMNNAFSSSAYPTTPQGTPLRVRANTLSVAAEAPAPDGQHDGNWFIHEDIRCDGCGYYEIAADIDWGLVHELSHQVSLIDLYAFGIYAPNVLVTDRRGEPVNFGFGWSYEGLMFGGDIRPHTNPHIYESHTAAGAATFAGYRNGYYGSYQFDIPQQNYLRILDNRGQPAANVQINLYRRTGPIDWTWQMSLDNSVEISGTTEQNGIFLLPNRSANGGAVTLNGHTLHDNPFGVIDVNGTQNMFLVQLLTPEHEEFHWLDITAFNLAYWAGDTISHTYTISSHIPTAGAPAAPELLAVRVDGEHVSIEWEPSPSPGTIGYHVYRATPPQYEYLPVGGLLAETRFQEHFAGDNKAMFWNAATFNADGFHRLYAITAVNGADMESGFSETAYAPGLDSPVAIALAADDSRMILNNWNLYPLLQQHANGRYSRRLVNPHYELRAAQGLVINAAGQLLVSGIGNFPGGSKAVRVYASDMSPLWGFGSPAPSSSAPQPAEFTNPTGIALWGPACAHGGPYQDDPHTLFLLHLDGSYTASQGEVGTANGMELVAGRYQQGVWIDTGDTLTYTTTGNLDRDQGAIEFWLQPNWNGNDGSDYVFFEAGSGWFNRIRIAKDGANNLRFQVWDSSAEYGLAHDISDWIGGEWHHVGVTWQEGEMGLYVDGELVDHSTEIHAPAELAAIFYIGSAAVFAPQEANSVIDEVRIRNIPAIGNREACEWILVADNGSYQPGSHRIQAFDNQGNFLAEFGSLGSGDGQFNSPQGLVVDSLDRVIVVDQNNNRLVLLSFDGQTLAYMDSWQAGFNLPTGVTADQHGYIYVADTGNNRIVAFDALGNQVAEFTTPTDGYSGALNAPRSVAISTQGAIVVADTGNRRIITIANPLWQTQIYLPMLRK